jgi:hypothetical protein
MAGRPRLYANAAEKTRAYRERQELTRTVVDRQWAEQSLKDMRRLSRAVHEAQKRGNELALSLTSVTIVEMMADLALYFESGVITPRVVPVQKQSRRKQLKSEPVPCRAPSALNPLRGGRENPELGCRGRDSSSNSGS